MLEGNKHYIRVDESNRIIKGFSDAFEQPQENDICINGNGGRHFELNGQVNPNLLHGRGIALYKYENGKVYERSKEEIIEDQRGTLEEAKERKLDELNQAYTLELTSGFVSNGIRFKYAEIDQLNFTKRINAIALGTSDETFYFGTADGVKQFTIDDFKAAAKDAEIHEMTVYGKLESLRQQVNQAETREEVESIVW